MTLGRCRWEHCRREAVAELLMPADEQSGEEAVAYCQRHADAVIASAALVAALQADEPDLEPPF